MPKKLKKYSKNWINNLSPDYSFSSPPYDFYGAFSPGGYYRLYHRVQAKKMKESYDWQRFIPITEIEFKKIINRMIQDIIIPVKPYREDLIFNHPEFGKGIVMFEIGDDENKEIIYFDLKNKEEK